MAKGKKGKSKKASQVLSPKVAVLAESRSEELRKDILSKLETVEGRVSEMNQAWDGIVQGLELRTKERYERASKKLNVVRDTLKEQAVVDLRNIGKVLMQLNRKAQKGMPKGSIGRMKDILDIETVFKRTTNSLDHIVDDRVHGNLRELQNRLDNIFKARIKAMMDLDKRTKVALDTAIKATRDMKNLVPQSGEEALIRLSKATAKIHKEVEGFSIKKIRPKKRDLAKLDKIIRDLNHQVSDILRKWPVGARPVPAKKAKKPAKA
jgi:hypothetical protein